ncbi:hypothetical protein RirG_141150 [Rhizophagus irregularis DAOM 197198w]|uniref:DUF7431 domain-containing protein n=1 Tax=Rhizophagus irregularis (strain DAOM 197198w) TaxID=1432141 RepID=A0A015J519_RHIIW|nr:hypothetical protein RirG_141150 [Rhizophagus irregularis DAOM 197198w]
MASSKVRINVSKTIQLELEDKLSDIREKLKKDGTIKMNDTLLFSKNFYNKDKFELTAISRENEKEITLNNIIEEASNDNETSFTLSLIETSRPYWKFLNERHKLDFGCTMTSNGIKRANQRAFKMEACQLAEIDIKKDEMAKFNSLEDWMIKKNLFFFSDMNVKYFAKIGKKYENYESDIEDTLNKYRVYKKASIRIGNLKATADFIKKVNNALKFKDPKKFVQITEEFGQFIPTEIILGERFKIDYNNANQTKDEKDLNDYRNWNIIEFLKPISIFELVDDDLRKELYSFFGKRILYSKVKTKLFDIENVKDDKIKIIELPQKISEIISNKHADCSIFATVIGTKDYYHCQILTSFGKEPKLVIHHFKEKSKDSKLVIGWMVVGYDTNFKSIFPDYDTKLNDYTQFKVSKIDYYQSNPSNNVIFKLKSPIEKAYYIGIPYTNKSNLVVSHYFSDDREKLYTFAYSPKDEQCVKLPKFSLHLLEITNSSTIFEKYVNNLNNTINLDNIDEFKNFKNIPKFISLYSIKDEHRKILFKQRSTQIKVKFFNDKPSSNKKVIKKLSDDVIRKLLDNNENFKCSFFVPFESDHSRPNSNNNPFKLPKIFRNNNNTINTKGKPFSDFSPLLEQVIELSEEIVKSCQSAENKKILEQFENNYALLEKLYNNTKNIENLEEISKSKILLIPKIKELSKVRKVKKSFDNDLVKIQTFMKSSKGRNDNDDDSDDDDSDVQPPPRKPTKIFSSCEIDKYGNMTTTMTEITTGEDGKTVTTVRTNLDSNSKTMYNATFISEPEEILITDLQDDKMDKKDKMKEIDETGDSGTIKEKTITFISSETDDYGDVKITSKIKISEDGKTTTAVTTTKKVSKLTKNVSKIDEIKEVSNNNESTTILQGDLKTTENQKRILYCSCTDKDGNITTIKTEITTGKDGKPEITVKTITIDSNGEEIYVANFVSSNIFDCNSEIEIVIDIDDKIDVDVDKIDEDVDKIDVEIDKNIDDKTEKEINNKGKEILKIVHFSGIPMKNQTKIFSYIEIDKDENETIIITEIKIDENENIITTVTITKKDLSSSNNYYNNDQ